MVPAFRILGEEEKKQLLERLGATERKLPKILETDPAAKRLSAKPGEVLEIKRKSAVAGETLYYRIVMPG